jgi:hypothetical protein
MIIGNVDIQKLKAKVRNAMRKATPKDTGNLAYNALRTYQTKTGINTIYHGNIAGYGKILNQSLMVGGNKNKHFGWHSRAVSNAIAVVVREFNPKAKGYRMYNNRQVSFKERSDANIAAVEGMLEHTGRSTSSQDFKDFKEDTRQEAQQRILKQEYKWKMNEAKQRFEKQNPMG